MPAFHEADVRLSSQDLLYLVRPDTVFGDYLFFDLYQPDDVLDFHTLSVGPGDCLEYNLFVSRCQAPVLVFVQRAL